MKNKTLVALLIIPFVIGLISFVSVILLNNSVAIDILDIVWSYKENEGFRVKDELYELKAERKIDESAPLAIGNELTWYLANIDESENVYAEIKEENSKFYLKAISEGDIRITCSNVKGTIKKSFNAKIFADGSIIINDARSGSRASYYSYRTYGQFDPVYTSLNGELSKKAASVSFKTEVITDENALNDAYPKSWSDNLEYISSENRFEIKAGGDARVTYSSRAYSFIESTIEFKVISGAYNVYNYNDLVKVTNKSSEKNNVVLQVNLGSMEDYFKVDSKGQLINEKKDDIDNVELFGNLTNFNERNFSFIDEVVYEDTRYNHEFLKNYPDFAAKICAGIELKGNLYGNGFYINGHDLCFPTHGLMHNKTNGKTIYPDAEAGDLFVGGLPYVTIGDIKDDTAIVKAYAEDNALVYVAGNDNIIIDDVKITNTNASINDLYKLSYAGTCVSIQDNNNVKVKNSYFGYAKNVVYAFSSDNLLVDNCVLSHACEFLFQAGSNKFEKVNDNRNVSFTFNGENFSGTVKELFKAEGRIDTLLQSYLGFRATDEFSTFSKETKQEFFRKMAEVLRETKYTGSHLNYTIKDVTFEISGIYSIACASLFDGPFLYNGSPSNVSALLSQFLGNSVTIPNNIGGTSEPVNIKVTGNTKFNDWKDIDTIDVSCLVNENIANFLAQAYGATLDESMTFGIEAFFPMKDILETEARKKGILSKVGDKEYVNTPVAYYGGGYNNSYVDLSDLENASEDKLFSNEIVVDLAMDSTTRSFNSGDATSDRIFSILNKCVLFATGFEPFRFVSNAPGQEAVIYS